MMKLRACIPLLAGLITVSLVADVTARDAANPQLTSDTTSEHAQQLAQNTSPLTVIRNLNQGSGVNALAFSRDGRWLAIASTDRKIRVWNVNALLQGDERNYIRVVIDIPSADAYATSLTFSTDGQWLVTGTYNGNFRRWDLNACDARRNTCNANLLQANEYFGVDTNVSFHPSETLLAGSNYDGTITLWDWANLSVLTVLELETGAHDGSQLEGRFSSLAFSTSGRYLTAGTHNKSITLWDFEDNFSRVLTIETDFGVETVDFSPTDEILASGGLQGIELRTLNYRQRYPRVSEPFLLENPSRVTTLLFSPDSRYLVSGDSDGTLAVWDVIDRQLVVRSDANQSHGQSIMEVTYDPVNGFYATASVDGTVKLWQLQ
ncbi:MAG: WD40 repeat domain-containing protein [Cyanobacteria bacterium J06659_2]